MEISNFSSPIQKYPGHIDKIINLSNMLFNLLIINFIQFSICQEKESEGARIGSSLDTPAELSDMSMLMAFGGGKINNYVLYNMMKVSLY